MIGWNFPLNNHGTDTGFNDGAIDTFAGSRLSSIVREVIQNSLDARKSKGEPVRLCFQLERVDKSDFSGFHDLKPHLVNCRQMARDQELDHVITYYNTAIATIDKEESVPVLAIHDFSTLGLTGPIGKPTGAWSALVKGTGITQKASVGSLGSFGHGSKAPFSYSKIRTVFYYTKIALNGNDVEERFQGKSILQTHESPNHTNEFTQATGFYGHKDKLMPLLNEDIPYWAKKFRKDVTDDTGTSIYVPFTHFREDLYPETKITVIANFFYAIQTGALEVTINNELIHKENVIDQFWRCQEMLEHEQDDIDINHINDCFKTIQTIIQADYEGVQRIQNFGDVKWYLRVGDELDKKIGIARSSGMLITRRAPRLEVFRNVKAFEMFVCVIDEKGSEILKRLENPTHDNFQFDRILDAKELAETKRKYNNFQKKLREVLNMYAAFEADEEDSVTGLSGLFGEVSDRENSVSNHLERGNKILIKDGKLNKPKTKPNGADSESGTSSSTGAGKQGGEGKKKTKGGDNDDPNGAKEIKGQDDNGQTANGKKHKATNLRINHSSSSDNHASLFFDSPISGKGLLGVSMVGEHGQVPVHFKLGDKTTKSIALDLVQGERFKVNVVFNKKVKNHTLEAMISEIGEQS